MKNKGGRPTVMTDEVVGKLEEAFAFGCTDEEACFYAGIHRATLYGYQQQNPEFIDRKEALKESPVLKARMAVIGGFDKDPNLALKFLERKKRDEFAPSTTVSVEANFTHLTDEQLRQRIEYLQKRFCLLPAGDDTIDGEIVSEG